VQLYELGVECGENKGDGGVVPVCSSMSWELSVMRTKATVMLYLCVCMQLYELGAECGDNEGDGDVLAETEEQPYRCAPR